MDLVRNGFLSILSPESMAGSFWFLHTDQQSTSMKGKVKNSLLGGVCLGMAISHVDWMIPWLTISSEWRTYLSVFCVKYVSMKGRDYDFF